MDLTIKPEFQNKVLGFNGSALPLGQRSQVDLKVLLVLAYQSHRLDYVNYYVSPPTLDELLGNAPGGGGADLTVATLMALLSNNGTNTFTQDGGKIRSDLNAILDAPGGLQTHAGATQRFYSRTEVDAKIADLYAALANGGNPVFPYSIFKAFYELDNGVTLVGGNVDVIADKSGSGAPALVANTAVQRAAFSAASSLNGKAAMLCNSSLYKTATPIDLTGTHDVTLFYVLEYTDTSNLQVLSTFAEEPHLLQDGFQTFLNENSPNSFLATHWGATGVQKAEGTVSAAKMILRVEHYKSDTEEVRIYVNGTLVSTLVQNQGDNTGFFGNHTFYLGAVFSGAVPFAGSIAAMGIVDRKTTGSENALINSLLTTKYIS